MFPSCPSPLPLGTHTHTCTGLACDGGPEDAARLAAFRAALAVYEGAHPYHNYTRRKVYQPQGSNIGFRGKGEEA